jgi:hypothetical protein
MSRNPVILCAKLPGPLYLLQFISGFATIAKLLTRLSRGETSFSRAPEVEAAFQSLKKTLCT